MLRNLYIWNFFPFSPIRVCEKKIGPGSDSQTASLTAGMKSKIDKNVARIFKEEMGKLGRG